MSAYAVEAYVLRTYLDGVLRGAVATKNGECHSSRNGRDEDNLARALCGKGLDVGADEIKLAEDVHFEVVANAVSWELCCMARVEEGGKCVLA